jgi:hypothetical protein
MRSLRFILALCVVAFFCVPFVAVASATQQYNPDGDSYTDFLWMNVKSNVSGTFVDVTNQSASTTVAVVPGTVLNFSQMSMYAESDQNRRVDFDFTITDNAAPLYSYSVDNIASPAGNNTLVFLSGDNSTANFNFTTVHGHVYVLNWYYRFHSWTWNLLLTEDDLTLTLSEPTPTSDTAALQYTKAYTLGGNLPYSTTVFSPSPAYGTIIFTAGDSLWGFNVTVLVGCNENVMLTVDIILYDGTVIVENAHFVDNLTSGYSMVANGDGPPTNVNGAFPLQAGHTYTALFVYKLYDGNATVVSQGQYSVAMHEVVPAPFYYNWMLGIIYAVGLFGPSVLLGRYVPRYGVMIGIATMSIVIALLVPTFIPITFISIVIVGVMLFIGRG